MGAAGRHKKRRRQARAESSLPSDEEEPRLFSVGAEVEARISGDSGFAGSFYEATVVAHLATGDGYDLLYSALEGDDGEPLRERAAAADVRPRPHLPRAREARRTGFAAHEMVEAFYRGGWWSGVVSVVPPPDQDGRPRVYEVAFPAWREVMKFEEAALRPNQVFEQGRWFPAAEACHERPLFKEGSPVEVNFGICWKPATVLKMISATNFLVKHRGENMKPITEILDSQYIRPVHAITRSRFRSSSHVEVIHKGSWWPGVISEVLNSGSVKKYVVKLDTHIDSLEFEGSFTVESTKLRPRFGWDCRRKEPHSEGHQLTSQGRPISASMATCIGNDETRDEPGSCVDKKLKNADMEPPNKGPQPTYQERPISATMTSCNYRDETRDEPPSCVNKKLKNADEVSRLVSPLSSVCNVNYEVNHKFKSCPEEMVNQQKEVLGSVSQLANPSLPYVAGFVPSLVRNSHIGSSSSGTITTPSVQRSGQLQAFLFGVFGQPRTLPQGLNFSSVPRNCTKSPHETRLEGRIAHNQAHNAVKKLEEKIGHKEVEDRQLVKQIGILAMTIRELELRAYIMRSIMRSYVSQKLNNAIEISRLEAEARELRRFSDHIYPPPDRSELHGQKTVSELV